MPTFNCPKCEKENEIEWEDLPSAACDTTLIECQHCEAELDAGWEADVVVKLADGA